MKHIEKIIRLAMPHIWYLFRIFLNDQYYLLQNTDIMAEHFGRGEKDVKEFFKMMNAFLEENQIEDFHPLVYYPKMKYQDLLDQITNYYNGKKI